MGLFKDMVNNIKQIVVSDDEDNIFINDDVFEQEEKRNVGIPTLPKLPFSNKQKNKPSSEMNNNQNNIGFDLNSFSMNSNRTDGQSKKLANKGHIQIYLPKNYEQVFDVIRDVRQGITAMVNVEFAILRLHSGSLILYQVLCMHLMVNAKKWVRSNIYFH